MAELSEAASRFGRSMCLGDSHIGVPLEQLTAQARSCVGSVGAGWQARVEARLAGPGATRGPAPDMYIVVRRGTAQVGSLRLVDGAVTLCLPQGACEVVGSGMDGLAAAESTLNHMGLETEMLT